MSLPIRIATLVVCLALMVWNIRKYLHNERTGVADLTDKRVDKEPRILRRSEKPEEFRRHQKINLVLLIVLAAAMIFAALR